MILQFLQSNSHCRIILLWTLLLWGSLFAFPFTLKSAKQFTADGSLHWLCVSLFPFYVCLERKEKQATGLSSWNWYLCKRIFCFVSPRNLSFSTAKLFISMFFRSLPRFCTLLLDASAILNTSRTLPSLYDPSFLRRLVIDLDSGPYVLLCWNELCGTLHIVCLLILVFIRSTFVIRQWVYVVFLVLFFFLSLCFCNITRPYDFSNILFFFILADPFSFLTFYYNNIPDDWSTAESSNMLAYMSAFLVSFHV